MTLSCHSHGMLYESRLEQYYGKKSSIVIISFDDKIFNEALRIKKNIHRYHNELTK